jgi:hypothetical protein
MTNTAILIVVIIIIFVFLTINHKTISATDTLIIIVSFTTLFYKIRSFILLEESLQSKKEGMQGGPPSDNLDMLIDNINKQIKPSFMNMKKDSKTLDQNVEYAMKEAIGNIDNDVVAKRMQQISFAGTRALIKSANNHANYRSAFFDEELDKSESSNFYEYKPEMDDLLYKNMLEKNFGIQN